MEIIGDSGGQVVGFKFLGNLQGWIKEATEAWITKYCKVANATKTTTRVGDLDPLHSPETSGDRPELGKLSDSELMDSVMNPRNGDPIRINTETGKVVAVLQQLLSSYNLTFSSSINFQESYL